MMRIEIFCTKAKKIVDKSIIILYDFIKITGNLIGYITSYATMYVPGIYL